MNEVVKHGLLPQHRRAIASQEVLETVSPEGSEPNSQRTKESRKSKSEVCCHVAHKVNSLYVEQTQPEASPPSSERGQTKLSLMLATENVLLSREFPVMDRPMVMRLSAKSAQCYLHRLALLAILPFLFVAAAPAQEGSAGKPFLHPLFSDHMVLQREVRVPVWGWAAPGTKVEVAFAGQTRVAVASSKGKWMVRLNSLKLSAEPRTMRVRSSSGGQLIEVEDVLVGDVWLCSGQSNMEMGVGACDVPDQIASADFPQIRLLTIPRLIANAPLEAVPCQWLRCSPANVMQGVWGGFSAAGFFFGRELHRTLNVPIGLIHSSWGGTVAEAWTSADGLRPLNEFKDQVQAVAARSRAAGEDFFTAYENWCQKNDPGTRQLWQKPQPDLSSWKTVAMPMPFENAGLPDFDGIVWFRKTFALPPAWAGQKLTLGLGPIDDIDTTWVNGVKVGQVNRYDLDRVYTVPADATRAGANEIEVRVLDTGGSGGLTGKADQLCIKPADQPEAQAVPLSGEWQMRDSAPLSKLPPVPAAQDGNNPNVTTVLYNGMIAPIVPFAIKGAIWYQGESNADRAYQYRTLLPAMIQDWRTRFAVGAFPFYIVQLAAWQPTFPQPRDHNWAELREAQALTAKNLNNCGLAVAIDIGDAADIHPKNKAEVGRRLALSALAKTYGRKIDYSGPWFKSMKVEGTRLRLRFDHAAGGLAAKGGNLKGFAIADEDRKFVWADAQIEGDSVVVSSPAVARPVAARYGWDINPVCNLYNSAGLPAVPFRTDDWPMLTNRPK
jgi:sialate O-acetylesterase